MKSTKVALLLVHSFITKERLALGPKHRGVVPVLGHVREIATGT